MPMKKGKHRKKTQDRLIINEKAPEAFDMARSLFYTYYLLLRMRSCLYELLIKLRINYEKKKKQKQKSNLYICINYYGYVKPPNKGGL